MNSTFWHDMVSIWCRAVDTATLNRIAATAEQHGKEDMKKRSRYSSNPLDDEDDDDDDFY